MAAVSEHPRFTGVSGGLQIVGEELNDVILDFAGRQFRS